ncbi:MAG: hypothetical protein AB1798_08645 [Spirochaetota bacterium]
MKKRHVFFLFCLIACIFTTVTAVYSADIAVPLLELITRGYFENSTLVLGTRGTFDLLIGGGYKFGGRLVLNLESDHLEDISLNKNLEFKSISIITQEVFRLPLNITYFTGELEDFCNGDVFTTLYGAESVGTRYRGYMYFPEGARYNGIYNLAGTGISISTSSSLSEVFNASLYAYQDSYLGKGYYSTDIRAILNLEKFKLESFAGYSFPISTYGYFRAGLLLFYDTGGGGEFLTQIGVPKWDPAADPFNIDLFYFLFEPRVSFYPLSIILTLFWHPKYYKQQLTDDLGSVDINVNFQIGNPQKSPASGGLESSLKFSAHQTEQFRALVSPYFSAITSGLLWNLKLNVKVFPFVLADMFEAFIGVRAEF